MIKNIIDLLGKEDYMGISKEMDIAKGMYSVPYTFGDGWKQIIRIWKSKINGR